MSKGQKIAVIVLSALIAAILIFALVVSVAQKNTKPSFTPPEPAANALAGEPEADGYSVAEVGSYRVGLVNVPLIKGNDLYLYAACPDGNPVSVQARVKNAAGDVIGLSGLIAPGQYVPFVTLSEVPADKSITVEIISYLPETYESMGKATFNTVIAD